MTDRAQRDEVLRNLEKYVVKAVGESGGLRHAHRSHSSREQQAEFREKILADPRNYIASPPSRYRLLPFYEWPD